MTCLNCRHFIKELSIFRISSRKTQSTNLTDECDMQSIETYHVWTTGFDWNFCCRHDKNEKKARKSFCIRKTRRRKFAERKYSLKWWKVQPLTCLNKRSWHCFHPELVKVLAHALHVVRRYLNMKSFGKIEILLIQADGMLNKQTLGFRIDKKKIYPNNQFGVAWKFS